jgi:hypothetical protein
MTHKLTSGIPSCEDESSVMGLRFDGVHQLAELVHSLSAVVGVHVGVFCPEVAPLRANT